MNSILFEGYPVTANSWHRQTQFDLEMFFKCLKNMEYENSFRESLLVLGFNIGQELGGDT